MKRKDEQLEETKKQEHIVWPFERVCPVCGKKFCTRVEGNWAYKGPYGAVYCSWGCLRKAEAELAKKPADRRVTPAEDKALRARLQQMFRDGKDPHWIAEKTGMTVSLVYYYRRKWEADPRHKQAAAKTTTTTTTTTTTMKEEQTMIEPKTMPNPYRKIEIGDLVLWSRPWSDGRALVTANEGGTNIFLYDFAKKHPDSCWLLEDEDEFTRNQVTDGAFSIVVDPKRFRISVELGPCFICSIGEE